MCTALRVGPWAALHVGPVRSQLPRLTVVAQAGLEHGQQERMEVRILYRRDGLYPAVEIGGHEVGRPDQEFHLAPAGEVDEARVLEEPTDDADHTDPVAHAGDSRTEATDPADDQIDLHAR